MWSQTGKDHHKLVIRKSIFDIAENTGFISVFLCVGTQADDLALSERLVYAVTPSGELMIRYNVFEDNPAGDYWKRVPGAFKTISGMQEMLY